jgi:uncharacterized protein (DUF433 family)
VPCEKSYNSGKRKFLTNWKNYTIISLIKVKSMNFGRITINKNQMDGMPCIRNLRIPVATLVAMVADGLSEQEILDAYPDIEKEDIKESLHFAANAVRERQITLAIPA